MEYEGELPKRTEFNRKWLRLIDTLEFGILLNKRRCDEQRYLNHGVRPAGILDVNITGSERSHL